MFYAKLKQDGTLDRYPYTLTDLRFDNPNTSFAIEIDDETAAAFGTVTVEPTAQPPEDYTLNFERTAVKQNGKWVEVWTSNPATAEQVTERVEAKARAIREQRTKLLAECDWTQLSDIPDNPAWTQYRQALRDVPGQAGFPWNVTWPDAPAK